MRRLASAGVVAIASIALAAPTLATAASAAAPATAVASSPVVAKKAAKNKIKIKKSHPGAQPGISRIKLTATKLRGSGKVKFTISGAAGTVFVKKVKAKKGKASLQVPALGTGQYKVAAKFKKQKGKTSFEVYDSALTLSTTTMTCDISTPASSTKLTGSVRYKGGPATTGYVDFYQNGNIAGGSESPYFLGFDSFSPPGSGVFDAGTGFCSAVTQGLGLAGGNTPNFGPGVYTFQAYYTADAGYDDYISSNYITVTVVP